MSTHDQQDVDVEVDRTWPWLVNGRPARLGRYTDLGPREQTLTELRDHGPRNSIRYTVHYPDGTTEQLVDPHLQHRFPPPPPVDTWPL